VKGSFAVRIGRVRGIDVRVDISALVIVVLIAWTLAAAALPALAPGYATSEYWLTGTLTALLFLASLLGHELSHSIVALGRHVRVRDITLWLLGGIAALESEPENADDELAIAVAGPVSSVLIGCGGLALAAGVAAFGGPSLAVAALAWLGSINLLLAVFNLAPAAPLDGGRVLRAWLWKRHGDRERAARTAARAGEIFGRFLVGVGILELLLGAPVSGIWAVLLGWFLLEAARAEGMRVDVGLRLSGLRMREVMTPDPVTVPASTTVDELLERYVTRHHCTSFPITDDGRVVGLATLARCRAVRARLHAGVTVSDIAWPLDEVTIAAPDELLTDVLQRATSGDNRVLVLDGTRLVGILSPSDVARIIETRSVREPERRAA
jgi:Zn-dependent protease/CBS domain-containing protein